MKSVDFVRKMFHDYYLRDYSSNVPISMIEKREFGFLSFEGWMLRHRSFQNYDELRSSLLTSVASDVYCSCAYYEDPEASMDKKGWLGADLVFDIDADHIPTPCDKIHDKWICSLCGLIGKGLTPNKCPACGGEKFEVNNWPCEVCLNSAKMETLKLLDMLLQDFGFLRRDVHVFFSGHRGYHIHVENEAIKTLDAIARKEISDYVSGVGLVLSFHGISNGNSKEPLSSQGQQLRKLGWRERLVSGIQDYIINATEDNITEIRLKKNIGETLLQNKGVILKNWLERGTWSAVKGIGFETLRKIAEQIAQLQSAKIDTVVTTDIHRLVRLAGTLHSKSGMKKIDVPVSDVDDFDPFKSAVAFKTGFVSVFVSDAPQFRLSDEVFGPYKTQKVELPTSAAMLLVCKNRAEVLQ